MLPIKPITEGELEATVDRAQRGEDLEKRKRPESLDEYFHRRNELNRQGKGQSK